MGRLPDCVRCAPSPYSSLSATFLRLTLLFFPPLFRQPCTTLMYSRSSRPLSKSGTSSRARSCRSSPATTSGVSLPTRGIRPRLRPPRHITISSSSDTALRTVSGCRHRRHRRRRGEGSWSRTATAPSRSFLTLLSTCERRLCDDDDAAVFSPTLRYSPPFLYPPLFFPRPCARPRLSPIPFRTLFLRIRSVSQPVLLASFASSSLLPGARGAVQRDRERPTSPRVDVVTKVG